MLMTQSNDDDNSNNNSNSNEAFPMDKKIMRQGTEKFQKGQKAWG